MFFVGPLMFYLLMRFPSVLPSREFSFWMRLLMCSVPNELFKQDAPLVKFAVNFVFLCAILLGTSACVLAERGLQKRGGFDDDDVWTSLKLTCQRHSFRLRNEEDFSFTPTSEKNIVSPMSEKLSSTLILRH